MKYVRYTGRAHRRVISQADWRGARLKGDQVIWEAQNGFAVPLDQFTDEQIKKAIEPDPDLVITEGGFEPSFSNQDMTPWELQQSVENPVDVMALLNGDDRASMADSEPSAGDAPNGGDGQEAKRRDEVLEDTPADSDEDPDNQDRLA